MDKRRNHTLTASTPAKHGLNANPIPSSSPAFATPAGPVRPAVVPSHPLPPAPEITSETAAGAQAPAQSTTLAFPQHTRPSNASAAILPVLIPPATLRPLAFRVFTKRHDLTLQTSALGALAAFVGRHCGSGWRDQGLADKVLDEVAKRWKRASGPLIVDGGDANSELGRLLKELAGCIVAGKVVAGKGDADGTPGTLSRENSFGLSSVSLQDGDAAEAGADSTMGGTQETEMTSVGDPRQHLRVISAFEQPRLVYNPVKRHFEKLAKPASLFPDAATRTAFFKQRYHMVHQRLMRNESFQAPTSVTAVRRNMPSLQRSGSSFIAQQSYKLSNITDLLGRHRSGHILLGLLSVAPAGHYAISDLTGSIMLDLSLCVPTPDWAWVVPGMIVIVDGTYEEEGVGGDGAVMAGSNSGIGGTIGGRFVASTIAGPPSEPREKTLGIASNEIKGEKTTQTDLTAASGFGWVDFLGVGSEKATGSQMRRLEQQFKQSTDLGTRGRVVIMGELCLDLPETFEALRKILASYEASSEGPSSTPLAFVLAGNFVSTAGMARTGTAGSIAYKESFDLLASTLADFPRLISSATFVFVPGDNDPWASTSSASASTPVPRHPIPGALTSRIRRVFQAANAEREGASAAAPDGEVVFTSNPARLSLFGNAQEMLILRDDLTGRVRRSIVSFESQQADGGMAEDHDEDHDGDHDEDARGDDGDDGDEPMHVDPRVAAAASRAPDAVQARTKASGAADGVGAGSEQDVRTARQLVKMLVDQSYLTPFSVLQRPVLWEHAAALHMVPLPTSLVLVDADAPPFAVGYGGCFVMNPGRCLVENRRGQARWIEYDAVTRRGRTMHISF